MTGDFENRLVARSTFGQLRNQSVAVVMPAPFHLGMSARVLPCCFERGYVAMLPDAIHFEREWAQKWAQWPVLPPFPDRSYLL